MLCIQQSQGRHPQNSIQGRVCTLPLKIDTVETAWLAKTHPLKTTAFQYAVGSQSVVTKTEQKHTII